MTPNYERAATAALETLITHGIKSAPVDPLPILKSFPTVQLRSYQELSELSGIDREKLVTIFGLSNQDAATTVLLQDGKPFYIVAYNMKLSFALIQRALARELGHIVLGHDGSLPDEIRTAEARFFAHHLLTPRPLIKAIQESGILFTVELLGNATGCYEHCLSCMREHPGVHVSPDLNRQVRAQFSDYIRNFLNFELLLSLDDMSRVAFFGHYMDGYEE